jgi:hypothetical protein
MTNEEYQDLVRRVEQGETLPPVEQSLFTREHARREQAPSALQKLAAERQRSPLTDYQPWFPRAGISRLGKGDES